MRGLSSRFTRLGFGALLGIGLTLVPGAARAKSAPVSTLPEGTLAKWTATKPARVEAKEKLAALTARREPQQGTPSHIVLEGEGEQRTCFQTVTNGTMSTAAQDRIFAYPQGEVVGARMEQIVVDPQTDKARLETTDIFLDPRTLGVRAGAKSQLDLATVARGPGLARVYAFREPGGAINVLVPTGARGTFRDTKGVLGASTCGHVRLTFTPESPNAALVIASLEVAAAKTASDPFARVKLPVPTANAAAMAGGNEPKTPKTV
ncbi:MAG: hypothetical protein JWM74_3779, partial [Myxococcaceae bacterium]|nr:hypothetical protein [Myxococcaceae bacterium]